MGGGRDGEVGKGEVRNGNRPSGFLRTCESTGAAVLSAVFSDDLVSSGVFGLIEVVIRFSDQYPWVFAGVFG